MTLSDLLAQVCIVLVKPSHPGNVGATARAMKTMGFRHLRLVSPKVTDVHLHADALALASGAADVLNGATLFSGLSEALHDCQLAYALTARSRELQPKFQNLEEAAVEAAHVLNQSVVQNSAHELQNIAFVFGCERTGLSNQEVLTCNRCVTIECNPEYSSLNLSQAVQIMAYEVRQALNRAINCIEQNGFASVAALDGTANILEPASNLANLQAVGHLHAHWVQAMEMVGFIRPDKPKKALERLQLILTKAQLSTEEVDMLRGFCADVIRVAEGRLYRHEQRQNLK